MARGVKFQIKEKEELYYLSSVKKAVIRFAVTAKLICAFLFAYSKLCSRDFVRINRLLERCANTGPNSVATSYKV